MANNELEKLLELAVSEEIIGGIVSNGCTAYFILETRDTENGIEVYTLLDNNGKPAIGKKLDGTDTWEVLSKTENTRLLPDLPPGLKNIAEDFLYGEEDQINGDDLVDLYGYLLILSPASFSMETAFSFCFEMYLKLKDKKVKRRICRGLLRDLKNARNRNDTAAMKEIEEKLKELEQGYWD